MPLAPPAIETADTPAITRRYRASSGSANNSAVCLAIVGDLRAQLVPNTAERRRVHGPMMINFRTLQLVEQVSERVRTFRGLTDGWDSYGAPAIPEETLDYAIELFASIARPDLAVPSVVPSPRGGVQFEWHENGIDFEVRTYAPHAFSATFDDLTEGTSWDEDDLSDATILDRFIDQLTTSA